MTRLKVRNPFFTLGVRCADQVAQWDVKRPTTQAGLHAIKGLSVFYAACELRGACEIDGQVYIGE